MVRVIDIIEYRRSWTDRYPELAGRGDGLMVILDPQQITHVEDLVGRTIRVTRPDGTELQVDVAAAEVRHGVVGLFLRDVPAADISRGTTVEW